MHMKKFIAKDMSQAIQNIRTTFGPDAVIISNKNVADGVEIVAAIDSDNESYKKNNQKKSIDPASENLVVKTKRKDTSRIETVLDPAMESMQFELKMLRGMLKEQLSVLAWNNIENRNPSYTFILKRLLQLGFSSDFSHSICQNIPQYKENIDDIWTYALNEVSSRIKIYDNDFLDTGGIISLVGTTGVGKTTTLAKLAARCTLRYGAKEVGIITTDSFRVAAHDQLKTYANILGINVSLATDEFTMKKALNALSRKRLILIDTAGISQSDQRLTRQIDILSKVKNIQNFLLLSSSSQESSLNKTIKTFGNLDLAGTIITKVDECILLGEVLSVIAEHKLPVSYFTNGQRVPEDLRKAKSAVILDKVLELADEFNKKIDAETVAVQYKGELANASK